MILNLPNLNYKKTKYSNYNIAKPIILNSYKAKEETEFLFQFLGIKLKFDDLLILLVLFFLYTEKVKDTSLFIILILLLFD